MSEFKFPDEIEKDKPEEIQVEIEGDTEIEVVDDTPENDRGRAPMREPPAEVTDDELSQYSEGVKKRIQHFSKGYHEERRAKEAALREREEALRLAQNLVEENKRLQGSVSSSQQVLLEQAKRVVANELDEAKRKLKAAYDAGDTDAVVAAQEEFAAAKIKAERVNNFKPASLQQEKPAVQTTSATQPVDKKAEEWARQNSKWFGVDDEMTSFAYGLHNKLVKSGVDPQSDEYYRRLNARMRQVFPDAFESGEPTDAPSPSPKKSNVVAPVTRSTAPKKIVLTQSQVSIAKRLGLTNEQYARAVAEEMRKQNA